VDTLNRVNNFDKLMRILQYSTRISDIFYFVSIELHFFISYNLKKQ